MAQQGGRVQLEQSDMRLAVIMAKMAKAVFSHATTEGMQYLIKKPRAEVQEVRNLGVDFPGHRKVNAPIERHLAMVCESHTDGCRAGQNGAAQNLRTCWRCKVLVVLPYYR